MPKKLTLDDMHLEARLRGGKCLSKEYTNARTPLLWECSEGHQWEATSSNVRSHNSWCPQCAGVAPLDLTEAVKVAESKGGKCVSKEYVNNRTPLTWECAEGHRWETTLKSIKNLDTWCPYCANNATLTLSQMQRVAIRRGGQCLSTEYHNCGTPMEWECSEGHFFSMPYDNIRRGSWCPQCSTSLGERLVRTCLEQMTGHTFPRSYPSWLKAPSGAQLELDGYSQDLGIAFEHHGVQHYQVTPIFHQNKDDFQKQKERDSIKRHLCSNNHVYLIEVPIRSRFQDCVKNGESPR